MAARAYAWKAIHYILPWVLFSFIERRLCFLYFYCVTVSYTVCDRGKINDEQTVYFL